MDLTKKVASINIKKRNILIPYIIIMTLLYIYCLPESKNLFIDVLIGSIIGAIWSYSVLLFPALCRFVWDDLNKTPLIVKVLMKIYAFGFSISLSFVSFVIFVSVFLTKNFDITSVFLITIFMVYNSIKVCKQLSSDS